MATNLPLEVQLLFIDVKRLVDAHRALRAQLRDEQLRTKALEEEVRSLKAALQHQLESQRLGQVASSLSPDAKAASEAKRLVSDALREVSRCIDLLRS